MVHDKHTIELWNDYVTSAALKKTNYFDDIILGKHVFIPNIIRFKNTIQKKILSFFNAHIKQICRCRGLLQ